MIESEKLKYQQAAGQVAIKIFNRLEEVIKDGVDVLEIAGLISQEIQSAKMTPTFRGFHGYPADSCISVNDQIVHAIPKKHLLSEGDIVTIDLGITNHGWVIDTARTYPVGKIAPELTKLLETTKTALNQVIPLCRAGLKIGTIGARIEKTVTEQGFYIIKELTGHGVGRQLQEKPSIPNFGRTNTGPSLSVGQSIAIEPITSLKPCHLMIADDEWTVLSHNHTLSCQFEHTIFITDDEPIVLTGKI